MSGLLSILLLVCGCVEEMVVLEADGCDGCEGWRKGGTAGS